MSECDEIQISVGIGLENGDPADMYLYDEGLRVSAGISAGDCAVLVAILRDAADALAKLQKQLVN